MTVILRIMALVVGYGFGLIQSGYIIGKLQNIDIREHGSGNSGATNAFRVMGAKKGSLVFLGDFLKALLPCLAMRFIFRESSELNNFVIMMYTAFGAVLGHSFPIHLGFRGGKGVACIAGLTVALDWRVAFVCGIVFIATFIATKYVSLASIWGMLALVLSSYYLSSIGTFGEENLTELRFLVFIIAALSLFRHKDNIKRLLNGTENKMLKK